MLFGQLPPSNFDDGPAPATPGAAVTEPVSADEQALLDALDNKPDPAPPTIPVPPSSAFVPPVLNGLGSNPLGLSNNQLLGQTPLARTSQPDKERQLVKTFITAPEEQADLLLQLPARWLDDATCQRVYSAIHELMDTGRTVNMHSVVDQIRVQFPLPEQETLLTGYAALLREPILDTTENLLIEVGKAYRCRVFYKDILQDLNRGFLRNEPIEEIYDKATQALLGAEQETSRRPPLVQVMRDRFSYYLDPPLESAGLETGLKEFDDHFGGVVKDRMYVFGGLTGSGKCLGYGTKVMMYDGTFKEVQNIKAGEQLMGPDSTRRNVLSTCVGIEQMYWVRQNKGIDYRVNESHILTLRETGKTKPIHQGVFYENGVKKKRVIGWREHTPRVIDISVRELLQKNKWFLRHLWKGFKAPGVEYATHKDLQIDPYYLGLWLGDGSTSSPSRITNVEPEIEDYMQSYAESLDMRYRKLAHEHRTQTLTITKGDNGQLSPVWEAFRSYNLVGNKHIPKDFLLNTRENRLRLLAGVIDTDGFYDGHGYDLVQKSEVLANDIAQLARSLGFYVKLTSKNATMKRDDGSVYRCVVYRVAIYGNDLSVIPCKVARRKATVSTRVSNALSTGIKLEKDTVDFYYGFTIDGDHRFLLEDLTVTHNTSAAIDLTNRLLRRHFDEVAVLWISLEMSEADITDRMYSREATITTQRLTQQRRSGQSLLLPPERNRLIDAHKTMQRWPEKLEIFYGSINASQIRQLGRRFCLKHQGQHCVIIVDHLGMVEHSGRGGDNIRAEFINSMKAIKSLQMDFGATTIPLVQLVKGVKSEARKESFYRPHSGDVAESGFIEQTADAMLLWWRPEAYTQELGRSTMFYNSNADWDPKGRTIAINVKNRYGQAGTDLVFDSRVQFSELQDSTRLDYF